MLPCLLLLIVLVPLVVWAWKAYYARADRLIEEWAAENSFMLVSAERCKWIWSSPFRFKCIRGMEVYQVKTKSESTGKIRTGWVRVGSFWPALKVPAAEFKVIWDDGHP